MLRVLLVLSICTVSYGSVMEFNDTIYTEIPPLYHLDEWSRCQRPSDVYCMVDAVLTSPTASPLLDFLKGYSAESQKHYNRTMIHRGVCITRCGGTAPETWRDAAQRCINDSLVEYGLEAEVLAVQSCSTQQREPMNRSSFIFGIVSITLFSLTLLSTVVHVLAERCGYRADNRFLVAFSLKRNWQLLTQIRAQPKGDHYTDLSCFEGIRFIGTIGVVLTHVSVVYLHSYIDNPEYIEHMFDTINGKIAFNTPLWMQVFFSISGFLSTYLSLTYTEKANLTFFKSCLSIINRYIRLTPVSLLALWFAMTWYPKMGSGPQWSWLVQRESDHCKERWWYHALYIHNYIPLGKFCMGHTWYLAVDMQLHIIGTFLIFFFIKFRSAVKPVIFVILTGSVVSTGLVVYFYNLKPIITAQSPEIVFNLFKNSKLLALLYLPLWMNLSGYFIGVAIAYVCYYNMVNGVKLSEIKWFNILFHISLGIAAVVSVAGVVFLGDKQPPRWVSILYSSVDRLLIALCFNIFLLGCLSNCKSVLRDILLWKGFHVLGRLSYSVFIVHFFIMRITVASNTQIGHVTAYSMISLLVIGLVLAYIIAIPVYLIVEMPAVQLWKAITTFETKKPEQNQEVPNKLSFNRRNVA